MAGVRKPYSLEDAHYGEPAVDAVRNWLRKNGYQVTPLPHGKYKWDCKAENDMEECYVEIERRGERAWSYGRFPWRTVHVPQRRYKSGDAWLFAVRHDLLAAIVVFYRYMLEQFLSEVPNNRVQQGELFFDVPTIHCLEVDLTDCSGASLAERNHKRVLKLLEQYRESPQGYVLANQLLAPCEPYGIDVAEWSELQVSVNKWRTPFITPPKERQPFLW